MHDRRPLALLWTLAQFAWGTLLFFSAVGKVWREDFFDYATHYTNWSWTLQFIFYMATAFGPLAIATYNVAVFRFTNWVIVVLLMPLYGIVWTVALLVSLWLALGTDEINELVSKFGTPLVMLGNDVYHIVPVIAIVIYILLNAPDVYYALNGALHRTRFTVSVIIGLYFVYVGPLITLLFYISIFDPMAVYKPAFSPLAAAIVAFLGATLISGVPLLIAWWFYDLGVYPNDERAFLNYHSHSE